MKLFRRLFARSSPMRVFIDTNIYKFSIVARPMLRGRRVEIEWGEVKSKTIVYEPAYELTSDRLNDNRQRRDCSAVLVFCHAAKMNMVELCTTIEVELERAGLPRQESATGLLYGAEVKFVDKYSSRIIIGSHGSVRELQERYLASIKAPRFLEICKATGAYQGRGAPLNRNQALDAYHLWCAEEAKVEYFVTMDYRLINHLKRNNKFRSKVNIVSPSDLVNEIAKRNGLISTARLSI